ncbi:MAG: NAD(P)H-dependent oxidoreductase subunit E [Spirochaetes bacterium]|nr:NAD(P)H-dependent oxidoreductase subunit E [Spirochaetota bacterium]
MITEQERQDAFEIIKNCKEGPQSLVEVLHRVQEGIGYLPDEAQQFIAKELRIPASRVYEVSTFYARFTTEKKGKYEISVCLGTACYVKGAVGLLDELKKQLKISDHQTTPDGLFTLSSGRCIGACALAPAITVNKDVHGNLEKKDIANLLEAYRK